MILNTTPGQRKPGVFFPKTHKHEMFNPEKLDAMFERSPDNELKGFLRLNPELRRQSLSYSIMVSRAVLSAKNICDLKGDVEDMTPGGALSKIIQVSNCAMFEVLEQAYYAAIILHHDAHNEIDLNRLQVNAAREKLRDAVQALINYDLTCSHVYDVAAQNDVNVGDEPLTREERVNDVRESILQALKDAFGQHQNAKN